MKIFKIRSKSSKIAVPLLVVMTMLSQSLIQSSTVLASTKKVNSKEISKNVTVKKAAPKKVIHPTSVKMKKGKVTLTAGSTTTLTAIVNPANTTNAAVIWRSTNPKIATVDSTGKVTAIRKGAVMVTATTVDGKKIARCTVVVINSRVISVRLNKTKDSLLAGSTDRLVAIINPGNASNKAVTWTTSDSAVVAVDAKGKITAVSVGTAIITATTVDGGKTAKCSVTVNPVINVSTITLNKTTDTLMVGDKDTLTAIIAPDNATNKKVIWTSSDSSVVSVDSIGNITAVSVGTSTITATTVDGSITAICDVTISQP